MSPGTESTAPNGRFRPRPTRCTGVSVCSGWQLKHYEITLGGAPEQFAPVPPGGPTACAWELAVITHERDAFVRHVLDPANGPDLERYLADTLRIDP